MGEFTYEELICFSFETEKVIFKDLNSAINNDIKDVLKLYNYAVQTRYPGEYVEISKEEYEQSIVIAEKCLNWIEAKIKESIAG